MSKKPTYEELKKAVNERTSLDKQLRFLSLAVEQSGEGIAMVDLDGNLEYINNAFAEMHGYSAKELVGKKLSIFHTPDQMPSVEAANLEIKQTGYFKGEIWHVKRDGTVFPTLMHNSLVRDETNKPIGMMGTVRDITDLKQAESTLQESEERYRNLVEDQSELICRYTSDWKLTFVNEAYCRYFGKQSEELIGSSFMRLLPEEDHKKVAQEHHELLSSDLKHVVHEHQVINGKGEIRWQQWVNPVVA